MEHLFRLALFLYSIISLIINGTPSIPDVVLVLLIAILNICIWKFPHKKVFLIANGFLLLTVFVGYSDFIILFALLLFDSIMINSRILAAYSLSMPILYTSQLIYDQSPILTNDKILFYPLLFFISAFFALSQKKLLLQEKKHKESSDAERSYRYELERTQSQLQARTKEIAKLTETRERNRIARDLHDNLGHRLAGILLQLQASKKIQPLDNEKAQHLLVLSIEKLSETLDTVRDTVHNLKPTQNYGIEYFERIINDFNFSEIEFDHTGSISTMSAELFECLGTTLKEALTNSSRYSHAKKVSISLTVSKSYTRLLIKDNGQGCVLAKEGLGLSGMRERIKNIGGQFSYDGNDGFTIVCFIPNKPEVQLSNN